MRESLCLWWVELADRTEQDRGLVSEFRVTVDLPADITLVAGTSPSFPRVPG
jgi:hypothetical protein